MNIEPQYFGHEQASELLPWLVNDTLEEPHRGAVQLHVGECTKCQADIAALERLQSALQNDALTPIVPRMDPYQLLDGATRGPGWNRLAWPDRTGPWLPVALAASLLLAVAVLLLKLAADPQSPAIYETASDRQAAASFHYVMDVQFEADIDASRNRQILDSLGALDVFTTDGTRYNATFPVPAGSLDDLQGFVRRLEARPEVRAVDVVAVQLPVKTD